MRTGGTFEVQAMPPHEHHQAAAAQAAATGWKSPVPYLFGGLAAMLGLIAFALLILACSYWKLSGYLDPAAGESEDAGADNEKKPKDPAGESVFMKSILVIMPGDEKPTRLATPSAATSRASSFGDDGKAGSSSGGEGEEEEEKEIEKVVGSGGSGAGGGHDDDEEAKS